MADQVDYEKQLKEMKRLNDELKTREKKAQLNMEKAAEYGKQLLYELDVVKLAKEKAEQEVYDLTHQLERAIHTSKSFEKEATEDMENMKDTIAKLTNDKEISNLQFTAKIEKLVEEESVKKLEYEEALRKLEGILEATLNELEEVKEKLSKECKRNANTSDIGKKVQLIVREISSNLGNNTHDNEEIAILQEKILQGQEKIQEMVQNNKHLVDENNGLLDRVQTTQSYATELKTRLEEAETEALGYQQSLVYMRTDLELKQNELSDASPDTATNERGNSLFSEVDDRRQIVEVNYKRLKEQFSSMKQQYDKKDQQLMKVKTQNVALLNRASANEMNPDHGQLYHLQDLLEREKNKNKHLTELFDNLQSNSTSAGNTIKADSSIHDSIRLQIRQNLETDEKNQQLTRKLIAMERNERKIKAENYQLKTELSNLKQSNNASGNNETTESVPKSSTRTVREFVKFDTIKDSRAVLKENGPDDNQILRELSASSNQFKKPQFVENDKKDDHKTKPRKVVFSDTEPLVCGDSENENAVPNQTVDQDLKQCNYGRKQSSLSGVKTKKPSNNLINAKEESEKLKEQCAQQ